MKQRIESVVWKTRQKKKHPNRAENRKKIKNDDNLRGLWDNMKHNYIYIIGVLEGEERTRAQELI